MTLKALPATETDAPRAVDIENVAYGNHPLSATLFPGPHSTPDPSKPNARVDALISQLRDAPDTCQWWKVIDTGIDGAADSNDMIAFSMWFTYQTPRGKGKLPPRTWGPEANQDVCELYFGGMSKAYDEHWGDKPHIYFKLLHTDPVHQRRGAGGMLLAAMGKEADALGLPAFLEATAEGEPLYRKHGFEKTGELTTDFSQWGGPSSHTVVQMTRLPRAQKG